ncbi:LysM peptidoglycan-binding domain-containing protein [Sporanaerobacter acetigenes]|uniref:LysM repeat-containing protein n=1 Tax=Sporanaerobacter acetigenes DSM 13106 TaxID=1123281 RepID=A0A1M5YLY9_9FIRM|nr:LysM domain-containing protein [Sporanaerobacter acetigenes]SHI12864.1 LysM repeat-containing protein [Sporanaerobacter acetigenes DSM 13106]
MNENRTQQACPLGSFPYTIKAGDTLYNIAIANRTTVGAIMAINPGINPNNLRVGQIICVPTAAPPVPSCPGGFYYTIRPGDTFYRIALQYNISVDALIRANPGVDPNRLQIGQVICIPMAAPPTPSCPGGFYYTIRSGDTLYLIAQRYNIPLQQLIAANPGIDPNRLQIGQVICIPR